MTTKKYDIILWGGTVVDPDTHINGKNDVGIYKGKIAAIQKVIPKEEAQIIKDARGKIITPGLIDMHAHAYDLSTLWGIPSDYFERSGVTTVVDAGSSGCENYPGLRQHAIKSSNITIYALLNAVSGGLTGGWNMGEAIDARAIDEQGCIDTIVHNGDHIVGVKIRSGAHQVGQLGLEPLRRAVRIGEETGRPVMVHIGEGVPSKEVVQELRAGDIVTHCYFGYPDNIFDLGTKAGEKLPDGAQIVDAVLRARERGVIYDVGHGLGSHSWAVAEAAYELGFHPDTISTDLHRANIDGPVFDLPTTLSKYLHMGYPLETVIRMATLTPATILGKQEELGSLRVGTQADIAVLELEQGSFPLHDYANVERMATQKLVAKMTIKAGRILGKDAYRYWPQSSGVVEQADEA